MIKVDDKKTCIKVIK